MVIAWFSRLRRSSAAHGFEVRANSLDEAREILVGVHQADQGVNLSNRRFRAVNCAAHPPGTATGVTRQVRQGRLRRHNDRQVGS